MWCGQCLADVDKPDDSGNTALHLSVTGGRLGITALLIAANADPDIENCGIDNEDSNLSEDSSDEDEYSSDEQTDGPADNNPSETTEQDAGGKTPRQLAAGDDKVKKTVNWRSADTVIIRARELKLCA